MCVLSPVTNFLLIAPMAGPLPGDPLPLFVCDVCGELLSRADGSGGSRCTPSYGMAHHERFLPSRSLRLVQGIATEFHVRSSPYMENGPLYPDPHMRQVEVTSALGEIFSSFCIPSTPPPNVPCRQVPPDLGWEERQCAWVCVIQEPFSKVG